MNPVALVFMCVIIFFNVQYISVSYVSMTTTAVCQSP